MAIITISRGTYSGGREVAEKVAQRLGYECLSREVLVEASREFNIPEVKLLHAIRDAPSVLDRFSFGKERYVAYIQTALLEHFQKDNIVYHGLAGHFFVRHVGHVLKVRIVADPEDRIPAMMQREGITDPDQARRRLDAIDETRRKWSLYLYGIDTHDPALYDLVIHLKDLSTDDAADIICHTIQMPCFQTTPESQQKLEDLLLAARVRATLIERYPRAGVGAHEGVVYIGVEGAGAREEKEIHDVVGQVPGVKEIEVCVYPFLIPD
ncbi:MAG TPA: cytidylate kinase-like family protein [Planctomycetes bacterium]|nr:cytidylate kinase-like family protein [Planctomycetota bacterium]